MKIEELKIALIQKIITSEDTKLLMEIQQILMGTEVSDEMEEIIEFIPDTKATKHEEFIDPDKKL